MSRIIQEASGRPGSHQGDQQLIVRIVCDECGVPIRDAQPHVVFDRVPLGEPAEVRFVHLACDGKPSVSLWMPYETFIEKTR